MGVSAAVLWQAYGEATAIQLRDAPDREVRLSAAGWLALSGEPQGWFSFAYVGEGDRAASLVDEYAAAIRARGGRATIFLPRPTPAAVADAARAAGWHPLGTSPLMVCSPGAQSNDDGDFAIERVATGRQLAELQRLIAAGFGVPLGSAALIFTARQLEGPGLDIFVARRGELGVSTATLARSGPVAGIFGVATPPEHRGQGAARAVLRHAVAHAGRHGVRTCYLAASEAGRPLYERLGFRTVAEVAAWEARGAADDRRTTG